MGFVIDKNDVQFLQKRKKDEIGQLFSWNNRVFRGIILEHEPFVRSLFLTGFLNELINQNLFPKTWIADYKMDGFSIIIEHEKIWPITYPQEWTFTMLKDAAIAVIRIAIIARKYGFNMKDCHGLNILFDGVIPKYVDLGSFVTNKGYSIGWKPYEEFLRFYYYPLKIWSAGNNFIGKLSIYSGNLIPHINYWQYKVPLLRLVKPNILKLLIKLSLAPEIFASSSSNIKSSRLKQLFFKLVKRKIIRAKNIDLEKLLNKIEKIKCFKSTTEWGKYHQEIKEKEKRFGKIVSIVNSLNGDINSAIDIAGNQGKFSSLLIKKTNINRVICIDHDENAIDSGYNKEKINGTGKLSFAHYNFMAPIVKLSWSLPYIRFKSDIAFALALTHHLILSQKYEIDDIFKEIALYAKEYVFIEFMPLGLWTTGQEPNCPNWHSKEWFRHNFLKYFDLIHEEQIAKNNILFVGKISPNAR